MEISAKWVTLMGLIVCGAVFAVPGSALATDPRARDGGLNDLVIYLASEHPGGVPEIEFRALRAEMERLSILIAPAVHVHRYYYNGNKQFQGPFVVGGPTVVVANHPRTNQRVYVETQLPGGYPEIAYDDDSITYIYPDRRVQIAFLKHHADAFAVRYLPGRSLALKLHENGRAAAARRQQAREDSQFHQSVTEARSGVRDAARGLAASTGDVLGRGTQVIGQVITVVPGVRTLADRGRQVETQRAESRFRSAVNRNQSEELQYAPTVR